MDAFLELGELFGRLATAASFTSVCTLLQQYAANYGLSRISFFDLESTTSRASEAILRTTVPARVLRRLDRVGDYTSHPLIERARETRTPFEFSLSQSLGFLGKTRTVRTRSPHRTGSSCRWAAAAQRLPWRLWLARSLR